MNIVIIEDNKDLAYMLKYILKYDLPESKVITVTSDFGQVIDKDFWVDQDMAIVDVMLPHIDGRVILSWLKYQMPQIHRIAWTALPPEVLSIWHEEDLAHVVIQKPAEPFSIIKAIKELD